MGHQGGLLSEGLPTYVALKGSLRTVNSLMSKEICLTPEDLSTFAAFIGFCICKNSLMPQKQWSLAEKFFIPLVFALLRPCLSFLILNKVKVLEVVFIAFVTKRRERKSTNVHKCVTFTQLF